MSELSRSLVDAAAEALCVDHGHSRQEGGANCRTCARRAKTSVAAVLETLAARAHWLKPDNSDGFVTAVEVNEALRRLAVEARTETT